MNTTSGGERNLNQPNRPSRRQAPSTSARRLGALPLGLIVRVCLAGMVGFLTISLSHAYEPPSERSLNPAEEAIFKAASLPDATTREAALRQAIRKGLLESSPVVANEVFQYLSESIRWLDLRPFEDIVLEFEKIDPTHRGSGLLDEAELLCAPRDERLRLYSRAIVEGQTTLGHGQPWLRQTAMGAAAIDGLAELKPLIEAHYGEQSAAAQHNIPLPELLLRIDLGAGAINREDAGRLASERLAAMKDEEFRDRMEADAAFRKVVGDVTKYACDVDPFSARRNPGCASVKSIVKRQLALKANTRKAGSPGTGSPTPPAGSPEWLDETWLGKMQRSSAGEPISERPH